MLPTGSPPISGSDASTMVRKTSFFAPHAAHPAVIRRSSPGSSRRPMPSEYYPIWMAIGDGFRARRLADRAHERYRASGWAAAEAEVTAAPARLAAEAFAQLGVALENAERTDDARRALLRSRAL